MHSIKLPPLPFTEDLWTYLAGTQKPILVYGMGNGADKLMQRLSLLGKNVADFFASDGFVRGQSFHEKRVLSFSEVKEKYEDFLVLVSFGSHIQDVMNTIFSMAEEYELYIPDMPIAGEAYFTGDFYAAHYEQILRAYDALADDSSRALYAQLIWYKLTGKPAFLKTAVATGDELTLLCFSDMKEAIDVGAYRGDTLCEMIENAPHLERVLAIEPDGKNFRKLLSVAEGVVGKEITCLHAAAWNVRGEVSFSSSGNRNATVGKTIDATASYQHKESMVQTVKIDDITLGRTIDYIKYDTEGAEMMALWGSEQTICRDLPCLRVSAYHRSEDVFSLLLLLSQMTEDGYDFYLRRPLCIPAWECDLIAVPKKDCKRKGASYA